MDAPLGLSQAPSVMPYDVPVLRALCDIISMNDAATEADLFLKLSIASKLSSYSVMLSYGACSFIWIGLFLQRKRMPRLFFRCDPLGYVSELGFINLGVHLAPLIGCIVIIIITFHHTSAQPSRVRRTGIRRPT